MAEKIMGVYYIQNEANGKMYIGSSVNIPKRVKRHIQALNAGKHHSVHLQRAWDKYGDGAFDHGVAEEVESRDRLQEREQEWIDYFGAYNVSKFADRPTPPIMTDERRQKMSDLMKGRAGTMKGKKHNNETRALMSQQRKGVKRPHSGSAISRGKTGCRLHESTKRKLSLAGKERWSVPEKKDAFMQRFRDLKAIGRGPWGYSQSRKPRVRVIKHDAHVKCYARHTRKMCESPVYRKSYVIKSQEGIPLHNAHVIDFGRWRKAMGAQRAMQQNWANPLFREKALSGTLGTKRTAEQKAAISSANKGRKWTAERRERYNQTVNKPEVRERLAAGRRGIPWTPEMREKILSARAITNAAKRVTETPLV